MPKFKCRICGTVVDESEKEEHARKEYKLWWSMKSIDEALAEMELVS